MDAADAGLAPLIERARCWLFDDALPLWSEIGVDTGRGFVEALALDGTVLRPGFKRSRVHARQIYVFSHAATLGFAPGLAAAREGVNFLLANGWTADGGWAVSMGEAGGIVASELDLYDQAFVILALAWWLRASGDETVLPWIDRTLAMIDTRFVCDGRQGYISFLPDKGEALQNPHMHLLEALLALYEVRPSPVLHARIAGLVELFDTRLFDPQTGTLAEYFTPDWKRQPGVRGRIVEPGHHYEWYWLLRHAQRTVGLGNSAAAEALFVFAEKYGVEPETGLIYDELLDDGQIHSADHRSWPQTERLKALLARAEFDGTVDADAFATNIRALFDRYLAPAPRGTWIDHLTQDGTPRVAKIPASTLYHIFLAIAELLRCAPQLTALPASLGTHP